MGEVADGGTVQLSRGKKYSACVEAHSMVINCIIAQNYWNKSKNVSAT